jgi:hypothetical protein
MGAMAASLLHYRPWGGQYHSSLASIWPIGRIALWMIFRRKIFWALYALALTIFLMFFFGQYMLSWAESQAAEASITVGLIRTEPAKLINGLRDVLKLNGQAVMYRNFFWWQGYMVMVVLALAGSVLMGNDFQFGSLPFYLSKPVNRWHYLLGKFVAVGVFVNLMTTLPAIALFIQFGLLDSWDYFFEGGRVLARLSTADYVLSLRLPNPLFFGILGYGLVLTVTMSVILLATASWLQRTVPLIMVWTTLFFFFRLLAAALVDRLQYPARLRLIDLWNDMYLVGSACLGMGKETLSSQHEPSAMEALVVLGVVCALCLIYLNHRIRAVEIVH